MWGTLHYGLQYQLNRRFIPTHVGNSIATDGVYSDKPVHPHTCGELFWFSYYLYSVTGSSPHMWGTLLTWTMSTFVDRFIPTHVGNSSLRFTIPIKQTVHPHTCGELIRVSMGSKKSCGSSPHMWGTRNRQRY